MSRRDSRKRPPCDHQPRPSVNPTISTMGIAGDICLLNPYGLMRQWNCKPSSFSPGERYPSIRPPVSRCSHSQTLKWLEESMKQEGCFNPEVVNDALRIWRSSPHKKTLGYYGIGNPKKKPEAESYNKSLKSSLQHTKGGVPKVKALHWPSPLPLKPPKPAPICQPYILNPQALQAELERMPTVKQKLRPSEAFSALFCRMPIDSKDPLGVNEARNKAREQAKAKEKPVKSPNHGKHWYCPPKCDGAENKCTDYEWAKYNLDSRSYDEAFERWFKEQTIVQPDQEPLNYDDLYKRFQGCFEIKPEPDPECLALVECCPGMEMPGGGSAGDGTGGGSAGGGAGGGTAGGGAGEHGEDGKGGTGRDGQGDGVGGSPSKDGLKQKGDQDQADKDKDRYTNDKNKDKDKNRDKNTDKDKDTDKNKDKDTDKNKDKDTDKDKNKDKYDKDTDKNKDKISDKDTGKDKDKDKDKNTNKDKDKDKIGDTKNNNADKGKTKNKDKTGKEDGDADEDKWGKGKNKDKTKDGEELDKDKSKPEPGKDKKKEVEESDKDKSQLKPDNDKKDKKKGKTSEEHAKAKSKLKPGQKSKFPKDMINDLRLTNASDIPNDRTKRPSSLEVPEKESLVEDDNMWTWKLREKPKKPRRKSNKSKSKAKSVSPVNEKDQDKDKNQCPPCPPEGCPCAICKAVYGQPVEDRPFMKDLLRQEKERQLRDYLRNMRHAEYLKCGGPQGRAPLHRVDPITCDDTFCRNPKLGESCDCLGALQRLQVLLEKRRLPLINREVNLNLAKLRSRIVRRLCESI